MSFIAAAILGAGALTAGVGAAASIYGSQQQVSAENNAINTQEQMVAPFAQQGQTAGNTLLSLLTPGPNQTAVLNQTPGFQFLQNWGLQGVQNAATTRGLGGGVLPAASAFATANAQQSAFSPIIQGLLGVYGQGASAAQGGANAIGSSQVGIGNALAGGATGVAGSLTGALNSTSNLATLNALTGGKLFSGMYGNTGAGTIGGTSIPGLTADSSVSGSAIY